jgi:hypothetical protein
MNQIAGSCAFGFRAVGLAADTETLYFNLTICDIDLDLSVFFDLSGS